MKRRDFLKISGASSIGMMASPYLMSCGSSATTSEYGLGLYTIRNELKQDYRGSLEKVAQIGFRNLEFFDYDNGKYIGTSSAELKKMLSDLNLKIRSCHYYLGEHKTEIKGTLINDWEMAVNDAAELGQEYMVIGWLFEEERQSLDDYKRHIDVLNKQAELVNSYGMQFGYHNHDFEFIDFDGQTPYDLLLERCDPDLVKFEMDMYWMYKADQDPVKYFEKHPGQFPLWHMKDMTNDSEQFFAAVGEGVIDWSRLLSHAELAGLVYPFVEQDDSRNKKQFEYITNSLNHLKKIS